jgi:hypothetical protein
VILWIGWALTVAIAVTGLMRYTQRVALPVTVESGSSGLQIVSTAGADAVSATWPNPDGDTYLRRVEGMPVSRPWHVRVSLLGSRQGDHVAVDLELPADTAAPTVIRQSVVLVGGFERSLFLVRAIVSLVLLGAAGFLLHHRGHQRAAISLAAAFAFLAVMMALDEAGAGIGPGAGRWILGVLWSYSYALIAPAVVAFTAGYRGTSSLRPPLIWLSAATWIAGILVGTAMSVGVVLYASGGSAVGFALATITQYALWLLLTWAILLLGVSLFVSYRREMDLAARIRLRWVLLGYALGALPSFALFILPRLFNVDIGLSDRTSFLFLLLLPVCLAVAVVRYQLLDIAVTLRQELMYGPATAGVYLVFGGGFVLIGYLLLSLLVPELPRLDPKLAGVLALLALLFHLLYEPLRRRVQRVVDRSFFRTKYSYGRSVRAFSEGLEAQLLGEEVLGFLCRQADQAVSPTWIRLVDVSGSWLDHWDRVEIPIAGEEPSIAVGFTGLEGLQLHLGPKRSGMAYHAYDQALLETLVGLASIVLQREVLQRRLFAEEAEKKALEQEFALAREIQERLLPDSPPTIGGYEIAAVNLPSQAVGGDYYDFIALPEGRWLIAIGDVVGHGIPAALLMANLFASLPFHRLNALHHLLLRTS